MIKEKSQTIKEWLLNEDVEKLSYELSQMLLKAGYKIIDSHITHWNNCCAVTWVLDEGMAYIRSSGSDHKAFFEMSSFNHENHLKFVISLKNLILSSSGNFSI